ncbi:hypothetical protein C8D72_3438 [Kushneria indalinina DSM 14324]|uniref:Uncharacterized protein n=1 Tax=Kushneria indalinina DSM 14324 TaxID=1122140 RepID=A0A3D9DRR1_9GAMM|nr:hypothetical protein C8D72_3438 [Kushneria indalinina DSM 14324]
MKIIHNLASIQSTYQLIYTIIGTALYLLGKFQFLSALIALPVTKFLLILLLLMVFYWAGKIWLFR